MSEPGYEVQSGVDNLSSANNDHVNQDSTSQISEHAQEKPEEFCVDSLTIDAVLQQSSLDTFDIESRLSTSDLESAIHTFGDNDDAGESFGHIRKQIPTDPSYPENSEQHATTRDAPQDVSSTNHPDSIIKSIKKQASATSDDADLVTWNGPQDRDNPHNWPKHRQWTCMILVSMFTFISPMASTMVAPALDTIASDFNITSSVERMLVMAIFLLAYAVGPFLWGPLSEVFGRVKVLQCANIIFVIFNTCCGFANSTEQMMAFRFLSGIGGSAPQAIGGGVLSDIFRAEERGLGISVYSLMPFISPAIAPIMGAYLTQYTTWRWVFWSTSIFDLAVQALCFVFLHETYPPAILAKRAKRLREKTGNQNLHTKWQGPDHTMKSILTKALVRPFIMLGTQPALQVMALFRAYQYGLMYLALATFPMVFEGSYQMNRGQASLNYLSLGLGFVIGLQISGLVQDKVYKFCKRNRIDPSAQVFSKSTYKNLWIICRRSNADTTNSKSSLPSFAVSEPNQIITKPLTRTETAQSLRAKATANDPSLGLPEFRLPLTLPFSLLIGVGLFIYGFSAQAQTHWIVPNIGACIFAIGLIICFNCAQAYVVDTYTTYAASATGAAAFVRTMAGFSFPLFAPQMYDTLGVGWGNGLLGFVCLALGLVMPIMLWRWGGWLRSKSTYCVG